MKKKIKEDLLSKNFWWIAFYYHFGRFPGSENFGNVPRVNMPGFLKPEM